jgi:hypothetical protein
MQNRLPALSRRGLLATGAAALLAAAAPAARAAASTNIQIPINVWTVTNNVYASQSYWTTLRDTIRVGNDSTSVYRGLLQADLAPLAGRVVQNASLAIELDHSWSCSPTPVQLWRLNGVLLPGSATTWNSTSSWWVQQLDQQSGNAGTACGQPNMLMHFAGGLTAALAAAVSGGQSTFAFGLRAQDESNVQQWKRFVPTSVYLQVVCA